MVKKIIKNSKKSKPSKLKYQPVNLKTEKDIAMDFATKVYQRFDKMVKSIILFGSTIKQTRTAGSDIDIIIILDDAMIKFDEQLTVWYREELRKIIEANPYKKDLHVNTVRLTTWWQDLIRGDPTIINMIRYGEAIIDFGGFFNPLKILLDQGKIKPSSEAIYTCLNRVPTHIVRSKLSEISSIEGCYWAFVDSAQALLMTIKVLPPSPEHIPVLLKENFVDKKLLKMQYVIWYRDLYDLHRRIMHGETRDLPGNLIDEWQKRSQEFLNVVLKLIEEII
ncbi:MAG: nucleotidyltransferase domain-containing protein [Candidatus Nanoarchaeia archaeon]|nr:nucleotidyltransferase domain-containing protein [Candidatus Nanoarchaeia archaeon]MDD5740698.1 nucleotidyltransferase domain-containing protein [Candidatus Nanoarchaeia archaeon]